MDQAQRRSRRVSTISALATAGLIVLAIGTPAAYGASQVTSASGLAAVDSVTGTITPDHQSVTGTAGDAITSTGAYATSGFAGTVTYDITPTLPDGLALDTATGVVSGTPTLAQTATDYTITATDGTSSSTATITITINAGTTAPKITPKAQSADATADAPITPTEAYAADGFAGTVTYDITPTLPDGLALDTATGVVSGTPTLAQTATDYTITATDGTSSSTATITITINAALEPLMQTLGGTAGVKVTPTEMTPHGFIDPVAYRLDPKADPLPLGLQLDEKTGVISGAAELAQLTTYTVIIGDDGAFSASATVAITISCGDAAALAPDCGVPGPANPDIPSKAPLMSLLGAQDPIHGPYSMQSGSCAACHRTHSAKQTQYLASVAQTSTELCFSCHNGTGAAPDIQVQYQNAQPNNPVTRTYFQHDPTDVGTHTPYYSNDEGESIPSTEFEGVLKRQSACVDCHNPHNATVEPPVETATGWTASGFIGGASGVKVTNGAAGAAPTYTLVGGALGSIDREYQLCFKCHSSYTTIDNTGFESKPSLWFLDKGLELNPANASFHPIEAAGTNATAKMDLSLAGPSPYKLWTLTASSTVRCANCHANNAVTDTPGAGQDPGQDSPTHTSDNASILIRPYRSQVLNTRPLNVSPQNYVDADYALCYTCHTNQPFIPTGGSSTPTNFRLHRLHVSGLFNRGTVGSGTDINKPGNGAGNAICAECHFRLHSTATEMNPSTQSSQQALDGRRLVSFSPNVTPDQNGRLEYVREPGGQVNCYLTCHGIDHSPKGYTP